jgi:hypothetical protein
MTLRAKHTKKCKQENQKSAIIGSTMPDGGEP